MKTIFLYDVLQEPGASYHVCFEAEKECLSIDNGKLQSKDLTPLTRKRCGNGTYQATGNEAGSEE